MNKQLVLDSKDDDDTLEIEFFEDLLKSRGKGKFLQVWTTSAKHPCSAHKGLLNFDGEYISEHFALCREEYLALRKLGDDFFKP